jgi:hypothetical protein
VLPNGTIKVVTSKNEDFWFALRVSDTITRMVFLLHAELILQGGFNNFVRWVTFGLRFHVVIWLMLSSGYCDQGCSQATSAGGCLGNYFFLFLGDSCDLSFD